MEGRLSDLGGGMQSRSTSEAVAPGVLVTWQPRAPTGLYILLAGIAHDVQLLRKVWVNAIDVKFDTPVSCRVQQFCLSSSQYDE